MIYQIILEWFLIFKKRLTEETESSIITEKTLVQKGKIRGDK